MHEELFEAIARKYYFLSYINPKDELLKYFFLDEKGGFHMSDEADFEEFVKRFRGDCKSIDKFVDEEEEKCKTPDGGIDMKKIMKDAKNITFPVTMCNYFSALEQEIDNIEMRN